MKKVKEINGQPKYCFYSLGSKNIPYLGTESINDHFKILGQKDKQSSHQWRSIISTKAIEKSNFAYEVIDRLLGRMVQINFSQSNYDRPTVLDTRITFMK